MLDVGKARVEAEVLPAKRSNLDLGAGAAAPKRNSSSGCSLVVADDGSFVVGRRSSLADDDDDDDDGACDWLIKVGICVTKPSDEQLLAGLMVAV